MKLSIIGLGYVGTVAAAGLAAAGHTVVGIDTDRRRIEKLRLGEIPIYEPGLATRMVAGIAAGNLCFQHQDEITESLGDAVLIATGTPPSDGGGADLSQVRAALDWIKSRCPNNLVVIMKSTVPPGTGRQIINTTLKDSGIRYASNPEFLREGCAVADWDSPDRIIIGTELNDDQTIGVVKQVHTGIEAPYLTTDLTSAEMIKYASNAFLATRVSFINEIASLCDRVGASIDAVSDGLALDPRAGARIHAGVGYGGSCFPKDVRALDYLALTGGMNLELLRSVVSINNRQRLLPLYALRAQFNGALAGLRIGVLGLAFKPGTDDMREAPSLTLIRTLVDERTEVRAFDPQASETARHQLPETVQIANSPIEAAEQAQALVLLTEWQQIISADWPRIAESMCPPRFVFDGRNALDATVMRKLGFEYLGIGRKNA